MPLPTYIFYRQDTQTYYFQWVLPASVRPLFGGKRAVKRSLGTDDERLAMRLARRLVSILDRRTRTLMTNDTGAKPDGATFNLIVKQFERLVDGTLRAESIELDPMHSEEEIKLLHAVLGSAPKQSKAQESTTLADLVKAYLDEADRAGRLTDKSRAELAAIYATMLEIMGPATPLATLTRRDFAAYKDTLTKLPANRNKKPEYKDKPIADIVALGIPASEVLSITTVNKNLIRVATLIEWATKQGMVEKNLASGLTIARSKRNDEEREAFTDAEVRLLLDTVANGEHGSDRQPYMRWIPWMGAYQGMRLNEIAQLGLDDFSEVDGIPVITVSNAEEGKRVKTDAGRRTIPIHPELVAAGLLTYVAELRAKGVPRLFPELSLQRDGYGQVPSKWFGRFRPRIKLDKPFHSLRHTVATKLREAGVPKDLVADILGHDRGEDETFGRYAKAASIGRMADALAKLDYSAATPNVVPFKPAAEAAC